MAKSSKRNKYKKTHVKIHPISFIVGGLLLAAVIISIVLAIPSAAQKLADEYSNAATTLGVTQQQALDDTNKLKKVSIGTAIKNAKKGGATVVYIGGTFDSASVQWIGAIDDEFKKDLSTTDEERVLADYAKNIYYVEAADSDKITEYIDKIAEEFGLNIPDSRRSLPLVLTFIDGKLFGNINTQKGNNIRYQAKELFTNLLNEILK
ncbi:hypothetical protein LJC17_04050 [Acholeplasma sp. OttesenSCG-928-E16]|nr:hypothetical protein [Acholeplasma sp. OttesenSCG-928-E16]